MIFNWSKPCSDHRVTLAKNIFFDTVPGNLSNFLRIATRMVQMIDEEIVRCFGKEDFSQADVIYHRYKHRVFSFFRYRGVSIHDAEDLSIDVFERVLTKAQSFDASRAFRPWFYQIMRNVLTDYFRKSKNKVTVDIDDFDFADEGEIFDQEEYKMLYLSLEKLSSEDRDLLLMAKFHRVPYSEIAESLAVTESAVKTRVHRTIRKLTSIYNKMVI